VERGISPRIDSLVEAYGLPAEELAVAADPKLRAMVAEVWWDRPMAVQAALLADPDATVRAAAVKRNSPGIPPELYDRCLADPVLRAAAAGCAPLTPEQFAQLLATGDEDVVRAVARNPYLSADMVGRLQDSPDPFVRVAVAYSRHATAQTRDRLLALVKAEKAAGDDDAWLALDWSDLGPSWVLELPLAERLVFLDCPHAVFRRALAGSRDLPDEAWQRLDDDADVRVRRCAARRPDAPPEVLLRLVRAHGDTHHVRPMLVDHPNFPRKALRGLADEPESRLRVLALRDPGLPVLQLSRIAESEEEFLRAGAARHPNVTAVLLERLLADPVPNVAEASAANPVLPRARMSRILTEAGV
jgi:hypothetical protein